MVESIWTDLACIKSDEKRIQVAKELARRGYFDQSFRLAKLSIIRSSVYFFLVSYTLLLVNIFRDHFKEPIAIAALVPPAFLLMCLCEGFRRDASERKGELIAERWGLAWYEKKALVWMRGWDALPDFRLESPLSWEGGSLFLRFGPKSRPIRLLAHETNIGSERDLLLCLLAGPPIPKKAENLAATITGFMLCTAWLIFATNSGYLDAQAKLSIQVLPAFIVGSLTVISLRFLADFGTSLLMTWRRIWQSQREDHGGEIDFSVETYVNFFERSLNPCKLDPGRIYKVPYEVSSFVSRWTIFRNRAPRIAWYAIAISTTFSTTFSVISRPAAILLVAFGACIAVGLGVFTPDSRPQVNLRTQTYSSDGESILVRKSSGEKERVPIKKRSKESFGWPMVKFCCVQKDYAYPLGLLEDAGPLEQVAETDAFPEPFLSRTRPPFPDPPKWDYRRPRRRF